MIKRSETRCALSVTAFEALLFEMASVKRLTALIPFHTNNKRFLKRQIGVVSLLTAVEKHYSWQI